MSAEQLSAGLALGVGAWLIFLAIATGNLWPVLLIAPAVVLAWGVDDGER